MVNKQLNVYDDGAKESKFITEELGFKPKIAWNLRGEQIEQLERLDAIFYNSEQKLGSSISQ